MGSANGRWDVSSLAPAQQSHRPMSFQTQMLPFMRPQLCNLLSGRNHVFDSCTWLFLSLILRSILFQQGLVGQEVGHTFEQIRGVLSFKMEVGISLPITVQVNHV